MLKNLVPARRDSALTVTLAMFAALLLFTFYASNFDTGTFAITRPVFDVGTMERFVARVAGFKLPIVAGLWPFESVLNAEFMANEVPGVTVPQPILERMRAADTDQAAAREGVAIAPELGVAFRGLVQGLHISAPMGRLDLALRTLGAFRPEVAQKPAV